MGFAIKTTVQGAPELFKALREINKKLARTELRKAINEASKLVLKDAKAAVAVDTGALKASLGVKIVAKQDKIIGIVGPRKLKGTTGKGADRKKDQLTSFGKSKAGRKAIEAGRNPVNYAHLVEFGTRGQRTLAAKIPAKAVKKRGKRDKKGRFLRQSRKRPSRERKGPQPFLRPALDRSMNAVRNLVRMRLETALRNAGVA